MTSRNRNHHPLCYQISEQVPKYETLLHLSKPLHIKKSLSTELQLSITLEILHAADTLSNPERFLVHVN